MTTLWVVGCGLFLSSQTQLPWPTTAFITDPWDASCTEGWRIVGCSKWLPFSIASNKEMGQMAKKKLGVWDLFVWDTKLRKSLSLIWFNHHNIYIHYDASLTISAQFGNNVKLPDSIQIRQVSHPRRQNRSIRKRQINKPDASSAQNQGYPMRRVLFPGIYH